MSLAYPTALHTSYAVSYPARSHSVEPPASFRLRGRAPPPWPTLPPSPMVTEYQDRFDPTTAPTGGAEGGGEPLEIARERHRCALHAYRARALEEKASQRRARDESATAALESVARRTREGTAKAFTPHGIVAVKEARTLAEKESQRTVDVERTEAARREAVSEHGPTLGATSGPLALVDVYQRQRDAFRRREEANTSNMRLHLLQSGWNPRGSPGGPDRKGPGENWPLALGEELRVRVEAQAQEALEREKKLREERRQRAARPDELSILAHQVEQAVNGASKSMPSLPSSIRDGRILHVSQTPPPQVAPDPMDRVARAIRGPMGPVSTVHRGPDPSQQLSERQVVAAELRAVRDRGLQRRQRLNVSKMLTAEQKNYLRALPPSAIASMAPIPRPLATLL